MTVLVRQSALRKRHTSAGSLVSTRRGAALIELAIILFLLFTIVFGCVDFGRFASTSIAVANAAREGASFGSANPFTLGTEELWNARIRSAVQEELSSVAKFDTNELVVGISNVTPADSTPRVRVEVTYPFEPIVPWLVIPSRLEITQMAEMPVVHLGSEDFTVGR